MYTSWPCALGRKQSNEGLGDSLQKTSSKDIGGGGFFSSPPFRILHILSYWSAVLGLVSPSCSSPLQPHWKTWKQMENSSKELVHGVLYLQNTKVTGWVGVVQWPAGCSQDKHSVKCKNAKPGEDTQLFAAGLEGAWGGSGLSCCWPLVQLTRTTAHICRQTLAQTYIYAHAQPPTSQSEILNMSCIWENKIPKHSANKSFIEAAHLSGLLWEKESVYFSGILCIIYFSFYIPFSLAYAFSSAREHLIWTTSHASRRHPLCTCSHR